ncbi:MAG TPA: PDGLE domain-containing protein, partial [Methanocorpusculum sp.]|nr:PDGLE domain-containing protein [Methanocorpusculum sp.]
CLPTMLLYHALIGVIEAVITGIIVVLIFSVRPELAGNAEKKAMPAATFLVVGLIIALVIGCGAVFFASGDPDGLDSTLLVSGGAKDLFSPAHGEIGAVKDPIGWESPMPDYVLGGEDGGTLGGIIALIIGICVALVVILVAARMMYASSDKKSP